MFKNVLVGVDGTPHGRDAIALASRLIARDGALTLAHVHAGTLRPSTAITPGLARDEAAASRELLEGERAAAGVDAALFSVVAVSAGRGLHVQAESMHADLLVVGSSRRSLPGRVFLGDDSRRALNGAPTAVAIASRNFSEQAYPFATIGVGYDASPESEAALAAARALAAPTRARIAALEVVAPHIYGYGGLVSAAVDGTEPLLEEARGEMELLDGVEGHVVRGVIGEELAVFSGQVDLLIVGSRNYGPVRRLVVGSTSHYLERHARCSLLVMPRGAAVPVAPIATEPAGALTSRA